MPSSHRSRRRTVLAVSAATAALALPLASGGTANASPGVVNVAVVGDMPYATDNTPTNWTNWLNDVNAANVDFTAHSGDFKGGSDSCSDAAFTDTFNHFDSLAKPFWYTPGDNDWTDCHRNSNGSFDPLDRLAKVRSLYFATPGQTIGATTMAVHTQHDSTVVAEQAFVENTWFNKECVTFGDIHSVTSQNGLLHPNLSDTSGKGSSGYVDPLGVSAGQTNRDDEVAARTSADLAWLDAIFAAAAANDSEGVFLMLQSEPALLADQPGGTPNDIVTGHEYDAIRAKILDKAATFGKPVVITHGDQHVYTVTPNYAGKPNITRLENFGSNASASTSGILNWVQVQATCGTPAVFSQRPRTVGVAPGSYTAMFAIADAQVPEGPLAIGLLAGAGIAGLGYLLTRSRAARRTA